MDFDQRRGGRSVVELQSARPIEQQVRAIGATWLDRELVAGRTALAVHGFGGEVRRALSTRGDFLIDQRFAERRGSRLIVLKNTGHEIPQTRPESIAAALKLVPRGASGVSVF